MAWQITINGIRPYDGTYPLDLLDHDLTTREWGWIKRHSGYLPLTVGEGLNGTDPELWAVFAAIALRRAGKLNELEVPQVIERIADAPYGSTISLESVGVDDAVEGDELPPGSSSSARSPTDGSDSSTSSASSDATPEATGTPELESAELRRLRWAN